MTFFTVKTFFLSAQSYSYFNMNVAPNVNVSFATATATAPPTTAKSTTQVNREREERTRPAFTEVHRAPFFQGLNLENPFKNEFDDEFEMTKHVGFPSFASQMDYDYNPYDSPAVQAPVAPRAPAPLPPPLPPRTTERNIFVPQLEAFSEEEILRSDLPPPGPSPPADFLVKVLPPRQQQQQQQQQQDPMTTERTFYRPNSFNRPQQPPTAPTLSEESVQPFPRSLSYFDDDKSPRVLPTTAFTFANENNPVFRPNFDHIPREPFAPPPELLEAARQKHFAGPPSGKV